MVDGAAGPGDAASVVAGVELGAPVLTEEGGRVVDVPGENARSWEALGQHAGEE